MTNVIVVIGAGSIGQAIVRRVAAGKHVLLADIRQENADAAAKTLNDAGFNVTSTDQGFGAGPNGVQPPSGAPASSGSAA